MNAYTFHISLYDLACLGTIFIGLTFAVLLWCVKSINRPANRFLALALLSMIWWMIGMVATDVGLSGQLPVQFLLALGPLIYFYVLKITRPGYHFSRKDLLHFIPVVIALFISMKPALSLLLFVSVMAYLYLAHRLIWDFYRRLPPVLMDRSLLEFRWLRRLLAATALLWLWWIGFAALGVHVYHSFYILFAVIMIWTSAAAFLKPQAGILVQQAQAIKPPVPVELKAQGARLKRVMEGECYHRDPELGLYGLAEKLAMSPHELSKIINTVFKKSFNDFINDYRVRDVIAKMQDPVYAHFSFLGIALECGFNSQSSFTRVFKQLTGKSPQVYKNELKVPCPSYNLGRQQPFAPLVLHCEPLRKWPQDKTNGSIMFKNYVKIAWRNAIRNKTSVAINISGLAIGLAASILILLWVQNELSYDRFHRNAGRIYRVTSNLGDMKAAVSPAGMAAGLKAEMPAISNTVRLLSLPTVLMEAGDKKFEEKRAFYADRAFMDIFSFPLLQGDRRRALSEPTSVLITQEIAAKYFGNENPVGKILRKDNRENLVVTGVFATIPASSHLQFDFILPMIAAARMDVNFKNDAWNNFNFYTYVQLDRSFDPSMEKQIGEIFHQHSPGMKAGFELQPLTTIHLAPESLGDLPGHGNKAYVNIFFIVAILILVVACINFMNLATARSAHRATEIGLRKVAGAMRSQLILQFLSESLFISLLSLLLAMGIVWSALPAFNELAGKKLGLDAADVGFWNTVLGMALLTGLLSGSYPAIMLSGFNPVKVLKGNIKAMGNNVWFRNTLVITQFTVSIVLLVGTVVIYQQLHFMKDRDPGFQKSGLLYMPLTGDMAGGQQALNNDLKGNSLTGHCTFISDLPTNLPNASGADWEGKDPRLQALIPEMRVDEDFIQVFGMKMAAGRSFSATFPADSSHYLINEKMAGLMGLTASRAIGKTLTLHGKPGTIVGVVRDFNFKPVQQAIEPLVLRFNRSGGFVVVRTSTGKTRETIAALEQITRRLNPNYPFKFDFLDQDIANLYKGEQQMGSIFNVFALLGVFISCLGLYGLSAFMAEQRAKEIGVRKVLGASIINLVYLLSFHITRLILIAIGIAVPLSWYAAGRWLSGFAYHIELSWLVFFTASLAAMCIAWLTVSYESLKAALVNPIKSLRTE